MVTATPEGGFVARSARTPGSSAEALRRDPNKDVVMSMEPRGSQSASADFRCRVTYFDDRARVVVTGRLNAATVAVVRRMVLAAAVLPIAGVTVDLAGVASVDRDAIDALVSLREQVRGYSAAFLIASATGSVRRAFAAAGVEDSFDYESVWSQYPSTTECA